ncbi:hypothetical protein WJX79_000986 [Trebouxia sp. C0005]
MYVSRATSSDLTGLGIRGSPNPLPVQGDCLDKAKAVKVKTPAAHNKLAVVRVRVAGRTFGVPAQLAERIAMYTDNATKQLQLDRQCNAYKQQRCLRSQQLEQDSQKVDHVLLNKTAILLPASMLQGKDISPLLLATAREHSQPSKRQRSRPKTAAPKSAKPNSRAVRPKSATISLRGKEPGAPIITNQSAQPDQTEDQHMPGELLHQKTAFPPDVFMRHEAATQQPPSTESVVKASQQQQATPMPQQTAPAGRPLLNWAGSRPASPTAVSDVTSSVPASVTRLPAAVSSAMLPPRSDSTAVDLALGSSVQGIPTNDEVQTRRWTAPDSLLKAATSPWAVDVRRLQSARPGSGGSPTARSEFLADSQALRQKHKAHEAEVRQRRLQFQKEKYEHQLQAAGFVVGLPVTQKRRQWRLMWHHVVAAYQLRCACKALVQQHKHQQMQEQRKLAAVKIAVWYKRLSETKQARQTLKAHRQLLPLSSLDKRREEDEKVAAASTIICFLQDIQRGHSFVRAVQTFQLKVQRLQQLWRNTAAVRLHQSQLLFMQLQRFTERHAAKLVRTGAAFLSGATLSATSASATRKGTTAASCLRRSRPGSGKATMTATTLTSSPRPAPAISEAVLWQVVDNSLKEIRKQYFADLDSFWDARNIYRAQLQALQHRAQVLSLKMVDSLPGILPPMQPRFRLLQSSQQLKAMLVRCHEINEANNSLIQEQQAITVTAGNDAMGEYEQLQDTMLAAYWAAVNV